jgi:hypothetical protein
VQKYDFYINDAPSDNKKKSLRCGDPIAYSLLPFAYSLLPFAYSLLPFAYSLLPIA